MALLIHRYLRFPPGNKMLRHYRTIPWLVPVPNRAMSIVRSLHGGGGSSTPSSSSVGDGDPSAKAAADITLKGMGLNIFLSGSKFAAGIASNSPALISDAAHSFSDIATDCVTLYSHKVSREPADWEHPFGHGKFESVGTALVGGVLLTTGLGVGYNSLLSIQEILWRTTTPAMGTPLPEGLAAIGSPGAAIAVALSSVLLKEAMYRFTLRAGEDANSKVVIANAHHHRSDALSSLVALAGIAGGVVCEMPWLDPVAGLLVAGMVMRTGAEVAADSFKDLVDTNVSAEYITEIAHACTSVPGVTLNHRAENSLRARRMGPNMLVDVSITVDGALSSSSAHQLGEHVRMNVMNRFPLVTDVTIHIDASHREEYHPRKNPDILATPDVFEKRIKALLRRRCPEILGVTDVLIIYQREKRILVKVDILLRPDMMIGEANCIATGIRRILMDEIDEISGVDVDLELSEMAESDKQLLVPDNTSGVKMTQ